MPDIIAWHKNQDGYNFCLFLELKTETGKLSQGQKNWKIGLNVNVTYSLEEAINVIDNFLEFCDGKS